MNSIYVPLGFFSVILFIIAGLPYVLRVFLPKSAKDSDSIVSKIIKILRKPHKIIGIFLVVVVFIHGYFALGRITLHTGVVAGISLFILVLAGILFYFRKKVINLKIHRVLALTTSAFIILHIIAPNFFELFI